MDCLAWLRNILYVDMWLYDNGSRPGQQLHS